MKKRILSAVLAMSMVFGMTSVTAFAEGDLDNLDDANAAAFEAANDTVVMPEISVTVPTTGTIVIDPFNTEQNGQISSTKQTIINKSNIPLTVTLKDVKATPGATVAIVPKALTDGTKWASVNIAVTDGLFKETSKVIGTDTQDIAVTTPMAPKGGIVSFKYTGTSATNITANDKNSWGEDTDVITATNAYVFTAQTFTTYNILKPFTYFDKNQITTKSVVAESEDATESEILKLLPPTLSGDGKEVPVTWTCDKTYQADTADTYTYTAQVADTTIYNAASTATLPSIKITVTAKSAG